MLAASAIVALFALLTATVKGVNGDLHSMLAQLVAWRCVLAPLRRSILQFRLYSKLTRATRVCVLRV